MFQIPDFSLPIFQEQIDELVWLPDHSDSLNIDVNWMSFWIGLPVIIFEFAILVLLQKLLNYHQNFSFSDHINDITLISKQSLSFDLHQFFSF